MYSVRHLGTGGIRTARLQSGVFSTSNAPLSRILFGSGSVAGVALAVVQTLAWLQEGWTGKLRAAAQGPLYLVP